MLMMKDHGDAFDFAGSGMPTHFTINGQVMRKYIVGRFLCDVVLAMATPHGSNAISHANRLK